MFFLEFENGIIRKVNRANALKFIADFGGDKQTLMLFDTIEDTISYANSLKEKQIKLLQRDIDAIRSITFKVID